MICGVGHVEHDVGARIGGLEVGQRHGGEVSFVAINGQEVVMGRYRSRVRTRSTISSALISSPPDCYRELAISTL